jgi:hypothetical protein
MLNQMCCHASFTGQTERQTGKGRGGTRELRISSASELWPLQDTVPAFFGGELGK